MSYIYSTPAACPYFFLTNLAHTIFFFFFFNDTATTEIYTLSLHDALPICKIGEIARQHLRGIAAETGLILRLQFAAEHMDPRSEEHTSELQSRLHLVCRLLLEKKKNTKTKRELLYTI